MDRVAHTYGIAKNKIKNHMRNKYRKRTESLNCSSAVMVDPSPSPERQVEHNELRARLAVAYAQLTPGQAEVFHMKYILDKSEEEIASELQLPVSTVKGRLFKARSGMIRHLREEVD